MGRRRKLPRSFVSPSGARTPPASAGLVGFVASWTPWLRGLHGFVGLIFVCGPKVARTRLGGPPIPLHRQEPPAPVADPRGRSRDWGHPSVPREAWVAPGRGFQKGETAWATGARLPRGVASLRFACGGPAWSLRLSTETAGCPGHVSYSAFRLLVSSTSLSLPRSSSPSSPPIRTAASPPPLPAAGMARGKSPRRGGSRTRSGSRWMRRPWCSCPTSGSR